MRQIRGDTTSAYPATPAHDRRIDVALIAIALSVIVGAFVLDADAESVRLAGSELSVKCPSTRTALGSCPGCGLTRSIVAGAHLRWRESLALHPAGILILLAAVAQLPYRWLRLRGHHSSPVTRWLGRAGRRMPVAILVLAVGPWLSSLVF